MEAVFGLVEDYALFGAQDALRDFLARVGGQAVHEYRILGAERHELFVDLIGRHRLYALRLFALLAHADPHVGVEHVRAIRGLAGIGSERIALLEAGGIEQDVELPAGAEFFGAAQRDVNAEHRARERERIRHVARGVAEERKFLAAYAPGILGALAEMLYHRKHVGVALAWVEEVGERVYDGQPRVLRESVHHILLECPDDYAVEKPAEYLCGVLDGLAARNLQIVGLQNHRVAAELVYAGSNERRVRVLFLKNTSPQLCPRSASSTPAGRSFL